MDGMVWDPTFKKKIQVETWSPRANFQGVFLRNGLTYSAEKFRIDFVIWCAIQNVFSPIFKKHTLPSYETIGRISISGHLCAISQSVSNSFWNSTECYWLYYYEHVWLVKLHFCALSWLRRITLDKRFICILYYDAMWGSWNLNLLTLLRRN